MLIFPLFYSQQMDLLNCTKCPIADGQEEEYDKSGVNHEGYSKFAGLIPIFSLCKMKQQLFGENHKAKMTDSETSSVQKSYFLQLCEMTVPYHLLFP